MLNQNRDPHGRTPHGAELDTALADAEAEPAGRLLQAAGAQSHPSPEFVHQLRADVAQQASQDRIPAARTVWRGALWALRFAPAQLMPTRRVVLAGAVLVLLLAVAGWVLLNQPPTVSAASILARAADVPAAQSLHAVIEGQNRESANAPAITGEYELWYQAPGKYRMESTLKGQGGQGPQPNGWFLSDGTTTWAFDPPPNVIQMHDTNPADSLFFLATSLGQTIQEASHGLYTATLHGSDTILGRPAYVVELTAQPGAQTPVARSRLWVDQQLYLPMRQDNWDASGNLLDSIAMTRLDVNPALDPSLFIFVPPAGVPVRDMRQGMMWQEAARQAGYPLFRPAPDSAAGAPAQVQYDVSTRQVVATIPVRFADGTGAILRIQQAPSAGLPPATGDSVAVGLNVGSGAKKNLPGHLLVTGTQVQLSFDRDGTRIVIETSTGKEAQALVLKTAQSMVPMPVPASR